jgi:integrase
MKRLVRPRLGAMPVDTITTEDVLAVLQPIWTTKTKTAKDIQGRIENVLDWCAARKYRDERNPARWRGHLDHLLANPTKLMTVTHHPALPWNEVPALVRRLRAETSLAARALEWLVLTAARSGEVLGARWSEIDLAGAVWTVPAERMKAAKAHRVPLGHRALEILAELPRLAGNDHLFPGGGRSGALPRNRLRLVLQDLGYRVEDGRAPVTPHGFRSSFRDWAGETTAHPREVIEAALAHVRGDQTEAAYARGDLFLKRRALMDDWAAFLDHVPAEVTALPLRDAV